MKARLPPRSTIRHGHGADRLTLAGPHFRTQDSSALAHEERAVEVPTGAGGPAPSNEVKGSKDTRRADDSPFLSSPRIRPLPRGRAANDAEDVTSRRSRPSRTAATSAVSARQEDAAPSADEAPRLRPSRSDAQPLDQNESNNEIGDATLTLEEKNFLDYLVKQALRPLVDKDTAPEPEMTLQKDET